MQAQITYRYICHGDTIMLPTGNWFYDSLHTKPVNGNVVRPDTNTTFYRSNGIMNGSGIDFSYTGKVQTYTVPAGIDSVLLQVWGAQGGQGGPKNLGGKGGFSEGKMRVTPGDVLYIYVGGEGQGSATEQKLTGLCAGGWNGGGNGNNWMTNTSASNGVRGGGGGATDISLRGTANSTTWNDNNHLYSRVIVAGGGGGNIYFSSISNLYTPGVGGGTSGSNGLSTSNVAQGYGATQTSGGANTSGSYNNYSTSSFGCGASASTGQYTLCGGGGGWYGGGAGNAAGGGSGYIYTAATASNYPTGCLLTASRYLANARTLAGNTSFPAPNGTTETGHSGNGYARIITGVSIPSPPIIVTVLPAYRDTIYDTICANSNYKYGDSTYRQTGYYTHKMSTINGCDSIVVLSLKVLDTFNSTRNETICNGQTFRYGSNNYTVSGSYLQRHSAINGCDSLVTLNLTVNDTFHVFIYDTICAGNAFTYNNHNYTLNGIYLQNYQTVHGCDSIIHINLRVNDTMRTHIYDTSYNNFYPYHDSIYTSSGTYRYILHRHNTNCDSTIILHLLLCDSIITTINDTVCNDSTYYFDGHYIYSSGRYVKHLLSETDCDSTVVLNLTLVNRPSLDFRTEPYCEGHKAKIIALTNGNLITWTSFPIDSSIISQEHKDTIFVSPQRRTQYTATVDSIPRILSCPTSSEIILPKPSSIVARISASPEEIHISNLQTRFTDVSIGNIVSRKWILHENYSTSQDVSYNNDRTVYYSPSSNSDSLEVTLMVTNDAGCHDTTIRIFQILKGDLWVPNAFTPDGYNNYLFKIGTNNLTQFEIFIYSRNGLLVFHSDNSEISWDGTSNGQLCPEGAYSYVILYNTNVHKKRPLQKVGTVMLVR